MLKSLFIQNYTLIDQLHISFEKGFSVITGETGAGKSILLGALNLLLGQRADSKMIRNGAAKCIIEAHFDVKGLGLEHFFTDNDFEMDADECIIRRELTGNGKSRAFINDTPAQLTQLKELGERFIDIHSQHQNLLLNNENFQLDVLDLMAHNESSCKAYTAAFKTYNELRSLLQQRLTEAKKLSEESDYLTFQYTQLDEARLEADEQQSLEEEQNMLSHAEDIKEKLYTAVGLLSDESTGAIYTLKNALGALRSIQEVFPGIDEPLQRMESSYIELKDIASEVESKNDEVEFNPNRLEFVNDRLNTLYDLQNKHHVNSVEELICLRDELATKLKQINNSDEEIEQLKLQLNKAEADMTDKAAVLTRQRTEVAKKIETQIKNYLISLGMPNVQFVIDISNLHGFNARGANHVTFLFNANRGGKLQDLTQIASGGEIARVMLSLKALIAGAVKLPTIIFDEIDTGVSGNIAEKMAHIMQEISANRQIISITHLPQIAAKGQTHYKVYKDDKDEATTSHLVQLTNEQRIEEIAHMLSGANLTEAAINNAKELLK